jgi:hypothetical protein
MWFHTCTIIMCTLPLALGWPQAPVLPLAGDMLLLLGVALTSFAGQLLMTRGLQLIPAAQASTTSFAQVSRQLLRDHNVLHEACSSSSAEPAAAVGTLHPGCRMPAALTPLPLLHPLSLSGDLQQPVGLPVLWRAAHCS